VLFLLLKYEYIYIYACTYTQTWVSYTSAFYGGKGHRECRARITNHVHSGQRGQAGFKKQKQAREQKRLARINTGWGQDGVFWLHDLIPGYALEQDEWVQKSSLSMFFEWSAVPFFYGAVCKQTCTMDDACLFFLSFFFTSSGSLAAPTPICNCHPRRVLF
jgi:hypothetical protein